MYKRSMKEGAAHTERGCEELFIEKGSAAKCRTKGNKSCFEAVIVTCEENPQSPQGHGATLTVVDQEASHQSQRTLDKAFGLAGK